MKTSAKKELPALLDDIRQSLETLESNLPKLVEAMNVSRFSKLPSKVWFYREALVWRMVELSRTAFENLERDRLVSGVTLTRAAVETSAALWYLCAKVAAAVESDSVGDIDDYLIRLVVGIATDPPATENGEVFPRPIRVDHFLRQADKDIEGFSKQYGILSEYAHPNWAGTVLLYAKHDPEKRLTEFGQNIRMGKNTKGIGAVNLSAALTMFERSYKRIGELIPAFTALSEKNLRSEA
jgi:hypothetical protein